MVFKWSTVVYKWSTNGLPVVYKWSSSGLPWSTSGLQMVFKWSTSSGWMGLELWMHLCYEHLSAVLINDQWEVRVQKKQMAFNFSQWEELIKLQLQLHYSGKFRIQYSYNSNNLDDLEYNMNTIQIQSAYDSNNL